MKHTLHRAVSFTVIIVSIFASIPCSFAQPKQSEAAVKYLRELPVRAGNNLNPYEFHGIKDTPAPKGFKPFYVSHYGRHGSRSDWGSRNYDTVISILTQAKEEGILSAQGETLLDVAERSLSIYSNMDGRLTPRGVKEHASIADRMYHRYPQVFKGKKKIRAISSTVPRCLVSMASFTNALSADNPDLEIRLDSGEEFMKYLSNAGDASLAAGYKVKYEQYRKSASYDTTYTMKIVFTDQEKARKIVKNAEMFQSAVYGTALTTGVFDIEEDIFHMLPFDYIYFRWSLENLNLYMQYSASKEYGNLRVPSAQSVIDDIIAKADENIASGEFAADLRFGHDHPFLIMAGYLGLEGVGDRLEFEEVNDNWLGFFNIPMASNLQLIFYRDKKGEVIVKFLFQEQETLLRKLKPWYGPYYKWEDVKSNIAGYLR